MKEDKDKAIQNPTYNLVISPPSQFPPFCPPYFPFYYQDTVPVVRLIKHETNQIIYTNSAVSQNSSPKNNYTGHAQYFSVADCVCQGKRFTQGHPVSQQ